MIKYLYFSLFFLTFFLPIACAKNLLNNDLLDKTFGDDGIVITDFSSNSGTFNVVIPSIHVIQQQDKKIIIIGDFYTKLGSKLEKSAIALARYNTNGTLDMSFGLNGKVILSPIANDDLIYFGIDATLQGDGKIVIAARVFDKTGVERADALLVRLHTNGTLDMSFGSNGIVREHLGSNWSNFFKVKIQKDGKILASGNQGLFLKDNYDEYVSFFLARYNHDGTADIHFGENGKVKTILPEIGRIKLRPLGREYDEAIGMNLQQDGKILAVGLSGDCSMPDNGLGSGNPDSAIARYNLDGKLDEHFGVHKNGVVITSASNEYNFFVDVQVQSDGKIVAIGTAKNNVTNKDELLLVRYTQNGFLDSSFGKNHDGIIRMPIGTGNVYAKNILLQKDGKIIITGIAEWDSIIKFTLVRYTQDGLLDTTFGLLNSGILTTSIKGISDRSFSILMQDDGKIIVGGDSFNGSYYDFALVRYNAID